MVSRWWKWAALVLAVLFIIGTITGTILGHSSGDAGTGNIRTTTTR